MLKHLTDAFVCLRRALEVLLRADLLADILGLMVEYSLASHCISCINRALVCDMAYLFRSHRLLRSLVQLLNRLLIVSQILLAADEDDGKPLAEMQDL